MKSGYKAQWCQFWREILLESERRCKEWERQKQDDQAMRLGRCQFWRVMELERARQCKEWERLSQDDPAMRLEQVAMDLTDSA